jgi:hypothetical protein
MPNDRHDQLANPDDDIDSSTRLPPNPPQSHTHLQPVAKPATGGPRQQSVGGRTAC